MLSTGIIISGHIPKWSLSSNGTHWYNTVLKLVLQHCIKSYINSSNYKEQYLLPSTSPLQHQTSSSLMLATAYINNPLEILMLRDVESFSKCAGHYVRHMWKICRTFQFSAGQYYKKWLRFFAGHDVRQTSKICRTLPKFGGQCPDDRRFSTSLHALLKRKPCGTSNDSEIKS